MVSHPDQRDRVERVIRGAVAAAVESMSMLSFSGGRGNGSHAGQVREGRLGSESVGVVAGGDQHLSRDLHADAGSFKQFRRGLLGEFGEPTVERLDLLIEVRVAARQGPECLLPRQPKM